MKTGVLIRILKTGARIVLETSFLGNGLAKVFEVAKF